MNDNNLKDSKKTPPPHKLKQWIEEGRRFLNHDLWELDLSPLSRIKAGIISLLRIIGIVARGFSTDKCYIQAGTLTYLTLMSLVPILALMFSVSKGLGAQEMLMENIGLERKTTVEVEQTETEAPLQKFVVIEGSRLAEMPDQFGQIAITVFSAVERTNVRTLGVIGLLLLLWTVIRVMSKVEDSFNTVWGVEKPRPLARRFSDYISILVVVPILVLCATSVNAFLSSDRALQMVEGYAGEFSFVYEFAIRWTMFGAVITAFIFLLMFMPNTRVRFLPALIGGFVTSLAWFAIQALYFLAQSSVTKYNAIYGTFAALPFFLLWLHKSWLIVLFGAELSFAIQNQRTYRLEQTSIEATPETLTTLGLVVMFETGKSYINDSRPWSAEGFASEHGIPMRLLTKVINCLRQAGLLLQLAEDTDKYVPGRDLSLINFDDIETTFRGEVDQQVKKLLKKTSSQLRQVKEQHRLLGKKELEQASLRSMVEKK